MVKVCGMSVPSDNETWIIETGDAIIQKKAQSGLEGITPWEQLVYCVWVADYGMRNAGDLDTAHDLYADYQSEARRIADSLSLRLTRETFFLTQRDLQREYFNRFEGICTEIRSAEPTNGPSGGSGVPPDNSDDAGGLPSAS